MNTILSLLLLCLLHSSAFAGFFSDHERGWFWYEDPKLVEEEETPDTESKNSAPQTAQAQMDLYKKELQNRLAKSFINPSYENVRDYIAMQKDMTDRSSQFSNQWMRVVYNHPEFDNTLQNPVNQQAIHLSNDLARSEKKQTIQALSKDYGLFFFFSGSCHYCHAFAPTVKKFSETYGWDILAISVDGSRLEAFPNAQDDNGLFEQWGVQAMPALFAVNPHTGHVIPIAYGMTSISEMETRIIALQEDTVGDGDLGGDHEIH